MTTPNLTATNIPPRLKQGPAVGFSGGRSRPGSGFSVQGSGFRVQGLGFRVYGLGV